MSTKHTPGRLESKTHTYDIADTGDYDSIFEIWGGEKVIAWFGGEDTDEANARRLVACWNRLEPFTTEQIEDFGYDLFSEVRPRYLETVQELRAIHAQRDELLAALEKIAGFTLSQFMGPHDMALECVTVACDSIAKVKGGAA